ncbi:MAG: glycoside hydrolase family 99-like domain-containing protein [Candidatus Andersenbacteria bacterium]
MSPPRLIAFHLPQYHPIPENDAWWGKGFTEWTNVAKQKPRFPGHYQPHVPADLGYYDLRAETVREQQAKLAAAAGIFGFCYYHYWFDGKLLLQKPLEDLQALGTPDYPFCLCWANEPWTRAWDGSQKEILMPQRYSPAGERKHLQYLAPFFKDPRYIRIDGKPLWLIYRAHHMPDPRALTTVWREEARRLGIGELYLCRVESFPNERDEPTALGFDAAVEFQPNWELVIPTRPRIDRERDVVFAYEELVHGALAQPKPAYKRFGCVTPGFDNSPRRKKGAHLFTDSTPALYQLWLSLTLLQAQKNKPSEQLVFINAWNEWGEGNHLEPDKQFGQAYLEATRMALRDFSKKELVLIFNLLAELHARRRQLNASELRTSQQRTLLEQKKRELDLLRRWSVEQDHQYRSALKSLLQLHA